MDNHDENEDVFNDDIEEYEDDITEITTVMSLCEVEEDLEEYEEQLNMTGI